MVMVQSCGNILSTLFQLEIASKDKRKKFTQTWADNTIKAGNPKIVAYTAADSTQITFSPDQ